MFGRSDVLEMIGELVAGVPRLQFAVDAGETHVRPVIPHGCQRATDKTICNIIFLCVFLILVL